MDVMMQDDQFPEARTVATACIQAWNGVSIEEAVTWKGCKQHCGAAATGMTINQTSRIGPERDIYLLRLNNIRLCPVVL
ncbi:hypothetical protein ABBQ32_001400 [Trebouxia sp. C0010 RCD-2024]